MGLGMYWAGGDGDGGGDGRGGVPWFGLESGRGAIAIQ